MPESSPSSHPAPTAAQRGMEIALSLATAPLLVGLMAAQSLGKWLQDLNLSEQGWGSEHRLPPLDAEALRQRQIRLQGADQASQSSSSLALPDPAEEGAESPSSPETGEVTLES